LLREYALANADYVGDVERLEEQLEQEQRKGADLTAAHKALQEQLQDGQQQQQQQLQDVGPSYALAELHMQIEQLQDGQQQQQQQLQDVGCSNALAELHMQIEQLSSQASALQAENAQLLEAQRVQHGTAAAAAAGQAADLEQQQHSDINTSCSLPVSSLVQVFEQMGGIKGQQLEDDTATEAAGMAAAACDNNAKSSSCSSTIGSNNPGSSSADMYSSDGEAQQGSRRCSNDSSTDAILVGCVQL
jgi:DNA repair exonuclease SbcCD ATPase subunit